ncbi:MAG: nucleotide sugar dehydrogenase [Candidatus Nanoarchaeia archaeon]
MDKKICIVGLGYVGLPLAIAFAKAGFDVTGFDVKKDRIAELKNGEDSTNEVSKEELVRVKINYTDNPTEIKNCNFIIVAVPTPIDKYNRPDLSFVESASEIVGKNLSKNSIVVFESTVYPGVTEEICVPIIEKYSGLKCGVDWKIGYSPERINPGDKEHTIDKIVKIVSGMDEESLNMIAEVYGKITTVFKAKNIKTAEAAKIIENIQRDLNIALVNELAIIFNKLGIKTHDVLEAASTKWNFHKYVPGLVGGHCIGVDPYYLVHKAIEIGHHSEVILAGRRINDNMHKFIADKIIKELSSRGKKNTDSKIFIMGLTFKENVKDARNSRVLHLINELKSYGLQIFGYDPVLGAELVSKNFEIPYLEPNQIKNVDCIIIASPHQQFKNISTQEFKQILAPTGFVFAIKRLYPPQEFIKNDIDYLEL